MPRAKFDLQGRVLVDRTNPGHTTFVYPALDGDEATAEASRRIGAGDYRVAALLSVGDHTSIRELLVKAAQSASTIEPNLSNALALVGGVAEANILRTHLKAALLIDVARRSERQQIIALHLAEALLKLRPSLLGIRALLDAFGSPATRTKPIAAKIISDYLLTSPPLHLDKRLAVLVPELLDSDDLCFLSAVPVLLSRKHGATIERCGSLLISGSDDVRRALIFNLIGCSYDSMGLLLRALKIETQLDIKVSIAATLAPALSPRFLSGFANELLNNRSPVVRLGAARLLGHLSKKLARRLAERIDPDPHVDRELQLYRAPRSSGPPSTGGRTAANRARRASIAQDV